MAVLDPATDAAGANAETLLHKARMAAEAAMNFMVWGGGMRFDKEEKLLWA